MIKRLLKLALVLIWFLGLLIIAIPCQLLNGIYLLIYEPIMYILFNKKFDLDYAWGFIVFYWYFDLIV